MPRPNESFRKVSSTLFIGRNANAGDWTGRLDDHGNLMNHQLYISASAPVLTGEFRMRIIPDSVDAPPNTVDTSYQVQFIGGLVDNGDSAILNFTGVLRGVHLESVGTFDPGITISAVLTSYRRQRAFGDEHLNYVSTTIFKDRPSGALTSFSLQTPNHVNMAFHQLMLISDTPIPGPSGGEWEIRVIPDTDDDMETSVWVRKNMWFPADAHGNAGTSFVHWFGGVFRGIHLKSVVPPESGHLFTAILSSSVERFDQVLFRNIDGGAGNSPDLDDHLLDFDNPHMTSWDNLLDIPTHFTHKEYLAAGDAFTIPVREQYLVEGIFDVEGTLTVEGRLVILGDSDTDVVRDVVVPTEAVFIPEDTQLLMVEAYDVQGMVDIEGTLAIL